MYGGSDYLQQSAEVISEATSKSSETLQTVNKVSTNQYVSGVILIVDGSIKTSGGLVTAFVTSETGVGAVGGIVVMNYGIAEFALGISTIMNEATDSNKDIPSGPTEAVGNAVDKATGNEKGTYSTIGAGADLIMSFIPLPTPDKIPKVIKIPVDVSSKVSSTSNFYNKINNNNEKNK